MKRVIEALLFAADKALTAAQLCHLLQQGQVNDEPAPSQRQVKQALEELQQEYQGRGVELKEVASGFRFQIPEEHKNWIAQMHPERSPRYSRALLETLAIIAYRQPITRSEIETIRGVSVGGQIIKTLLEREWIQVLGHREVPGKPTIFGTTKAFLDYFNLKDIDQLPSLVELRNMENFQLQIDLLENNEAVE